MYGLEENNPLDMHSRLHVPKHIRMSMGWKIDDVIKMVVTPDGLLLNKANNAVLVKCDMCNANEVEGITIKTESICYRCLNK